MFEFAQQIERRLMIIGIPLRPGSAQSFFEARHQRSLLVQGQRLGKNLLAEIG